MTKQEIRLIFKEKRKQLTQEEVQRLSLKICQKTKTFLKEHSQIQHIHVFLPIIKLKEVNIFTLIENLLDENYHLYTSVLSKGDRKLKTVFLKDTQNLDEDDWGIPIPNSLDEVSTDQISLVLIPLLACDKNGNRVGYGKGYYDEFLSELKSDVLKVGLSFFDPIEKIESEWHDIPLDVCITPSMVFLF